MPSLNPNDELSGGGGGKGARPKVLVSGCFDLLHNGHIEFFKEAASHGDLYVRIGRAANIKKLKNHNTMYSDEERLYMVQSVKWVHDAAVSAGWGMFDYLEDAKAIKPDIYFVNEDASQARTADAAPPPRPPPRAAPAPPPRRTRASRSRVRRARRRS